LDDAKLSHQKQQLEMSKISAMGVQIFFNHLISEMNVGCDSALVSLSEIKNIPIVLFEHFLNEGIDGIYFITGNGRTDVISGSNPTEQEIKDVMKFRTADIYFTNIFKEDSLSNKKYLFLCKKLNPEFRDSKIFFLKINFDYIIQKYLLPLQLTKSDFAWILNDEGTLIYHPEHEDMILRNIFESTAECGDCHKSFEMQKNMLVQKSGYGEYVIGDEPSKIMAYSPIKIADRHWYLAISTYLPNVISALKSKLNLLILTSALIFIIIMGFTIFNYRSNLGRIKADEERKRTLQEMKFQEDLNHVSKLASLGELVDTVAHEVNTPTGIISIQADALKIKSLGNHLAEEIEIIKKQVDRISNYTRSLLNYSKRLPFNPQLTNIISVIDDSVFLLAHRFREKKIKFIKDYGTTFPELMIDRVQIEQVFINILNNAFDSMNEGGSINITVKENLSESESSKAPGGVIIQIKNSGEKIPENIINQIFEPFFTTKHESDGTGLGLSISKKIILRHGGSIIAENTETGPMFTIKLPYKFTQVY
jgi:signal transduction histidine kinase